MRGLSHMSEAHRCLHLCVLKRYCFSSLEWGPILFKPLSCFMSMEVSMNEWIWTSTQLVFGMNWNVTNISAWSHEDSCGWTNTSHNRAPKPSVAQSNTDNHKWVWWSGIHIVCIWLYGVQLLTKRTCLKNFFRNIIGIEPGQRNHSAQKHQLLNKYTVRTTDYNSSLWSSLQWCGKRWYFAYFWWIAFS